MGGSLGFNKSKQASSTNQDVWGPQGDALQDLYGQAGDLFSSGQSYFDRMNEQAQGLGGYNQQLMDQGMAGQQNMLGGGAYGDTSGARDMLMSNLQQQSQGGSQMGRMYESIVGGAGNEYIDPMVQAMRRSGNQALAQQQSGTGLDAVKAGQSGGSRQAMQNAMQGNMAEQGMMDREMNMRGGAYDKDMQMKLAIARQADTGMQNTNQTLMNMLGGAQGAMQQGMGAGQGLQNLGMGSLAPTMQAGQAPWDMMNQYSNVIGRPTVLGSGVSSGSSMGASGGAGAKG